MRRNYLFMSVIILAVLVGLFWFFSRQTTTPPSPRKILVDAPEIAQQNYDELAQDGIPYLLLSLSACTKDAVTVYVVTWGGGFSGGENYYAADGTKLGTYKWDDMLVPGRVIPKPLIDKKEYQCTVLKESGQLKR